MRLRRVEAIRYGALRDAVLGDFGDGLTIVIGRNESGKSTFTSLVRHVLYGFPRGRGSERQYLTPTSDNRRGRLVFSDGRESWIVDRTEGPRGGEAAIHGPRGSEPGAAFLDQLTSGVSVEVFRSVFGFGLEELSDLESLEGIESRLYASTVGLSVNPHDVLLELQRRAEALWAPRARTREIHSLAAEIREVRAELRHLDEDIERFRSDRTRLVEVQSELEAAESSLREARLDEERLAAMLAEAWRIEERVREFREEAAAKRQRAEELARDAEALTVEEDLLERAAEIDRLTNRLEVFSSDAARLREAEDRLGQIDDEIHRQVGELGEGWSYGSVLEYSVDAAAENALDEAEERIREARRARDEAARRATEARAQLESANFEAHSLLEAAEMLGCEDPEGTAAERIMAVDHLLTIGDVSGSRSPWTIPAASLAGVAGVLVVVGLTISDRALLLAAALPAIVMIALLTWDRFGRRREAPPEVAGLLAVLGVKEALPSGELVRLKNALERLRDAQQSVNKVRLDVAACEAAAAESAESLDRIWTDWIAWLDERGLRTSSDQPASVRRTLQRVREVQGRVESRAHVEDEAASSRKSCEEYAATAEALGALPDADEEKVDLSDVMHGVKGVANRLMSARGSAEHRENLLEERARLLEQAESLDARSDAVQGELEELPTAAGVADAGTLADLEAQVAVAKRHAEECEVERTGLREEKGVLEGKLEQAMGDRSRTRLRFREAGLEQRLRRTVESYVVIALAARLLSEALESHERDRQPAVIQRAQELFAALTEGRYVRLATRLGEFRPTVTDEASETRPPEHLSRATAEQLFLALRLSYIENLSIAHSALPVLMDDVLVNFDAGRRQAAAKVIAEFAEQRQVVFFTCRQATVEVFANHGSNITVIELG